MLRYFRGRKITNIDNKAMVIIFNAVLLIGFIIFVISMGINFATSYFSNQRDKQEDNNSELVSDELHFVDYYGTNIFVNNDDLFELFYQDLNDYTFLEQNDFVIKDDQIQYKKDNEFIKTGIKSESLYNSCIPNDDFNKLLCKVDFADTNDWEKDQYFFVLDKDKKQIDQFTKSKQEDVVIRDKKCKWIEKDKIFCILKTSVENFAQLFVCDNEKYQAQDLPENGYELDKIGKFYISTARKDSESDRFWYKILYDLEFKKLYELDSYKYDTFVYANYIMYGDYCYNGKQNCIKLYRIDNKGDRKELEVELENKCNLDYSRNLEYFVADKKMFVTACSKVLVINPEKFQILHQYRFEDESYVAVGQYKDYLLAFKGAQMIQQSKLITFAQQSMAVYEVKSCKNGMLDSKCEKYSYESELLNDIFPERSSLVFSNEFIYSSISSNYVFNINKYRDMEVKVYNLGSKDIKTFNILALRIFISDYGNFVLFPVLSENKVDKFVIVDLRVNEIVPDLDLIEGVNLFVVDESL